MAAKKQKTVTNWLAGDSTYKATLAALGKQLANYNTDLNAQQNNYNTNYGMSLKDLGYAPGAAAVAAVKNKAGKVIKPAVAAKPGVWNMEDRTTASGAANQNLNNDFAARGLVHSSGYADAGNDLQRSLNNQLATLNTQRSQYLTGLSNQRTSYRDQNASAIQQARAQSVARRAATYGLT